MDRRVRGALGTGALFLSVQLLALAVAPRLVAGGVSYGDGDDALVPLVLGLAVGTLLSLAAVRYRRSERLVRAVMLLSVGVALWVAAAAFLGAVPGALAAAVGVAVAWRVQRWEVRNLVAVVAVAGAAGLFGASLSPPYALVALVLAAAYDAYAVYVSGHMATMVDASARMGLPSAFVVPTGDGVPDGAVGTGGNGTTVATLLGAGDALFPAILTASAAVEQAAGPGFGHAPSPVLGLPPSALGALLGSFTGFVALQVLVQRRGGMHAGLPFVNGGAVLGYLLAASIGPVPV
ncbi:presenilin family intramembrane aspartyl protease PSH [Halorarum salinum]|uniref:Presenilin-like membrane protease, A22 family n=1 Tax=Halorarum salinum TaxID=2743089 RepID=A0A7D5LCW0_9EURY|nr:presenilin family intramembrane aspartyl protease PSH [Halobaculum salinum]QLG62975.1 hypothetical protein HUG12_15040 [Halobaculum salinum]